MDHNANIWNTNIQQRKENESEENEDGGRIITSLFLLYIYKCVVTVQHKNRIEGWKNIKRH